MNFFDFGEVIEKDINFVIFGVPWDYLTSIEGPNSALAPEAIRNVTNDLGLTTEMGKEVHTLKCVDMGDVAIESTNVEKNLKEIKNFITAICQQKSDVVLVMMGGDHFCTYPVLKTVGDNFDKKSEFGVLIFDSHLDLYEEWDKGVYSHATISHRILDLDYITNKNLLIVGTRDVDTLELEIAKKESITYLEAYRLSEIGLDKYITEITNFFNSSNIKYLYVSIDVDSLDPSIAPGTGYAIPGGFTYREIWRILRELANKFEIIAFDLVEVAPNLDLDNKVTCNLAAKLIIEFMSFIKK